MKNIIVSTDFSEASSNAGEYAAELACAFHANIKIVNAIAPLLIIDDVAAPSLVISQEEVIKENKDLMAEEINRLSEKYTVKIEGYVGEGSPLDIIPEIAKENHADVIIMGMKGKGKSNSVFGSTTTSIIRKSSFAVLVIPEKVFFKRIDKITFAIDFNNDKQLSEYTLLKQIAEKFDSFINIMNVQKNGYALTPEYISAKMEADVAFANLKHEFYGVANNNVVEGINNFMKENPADLLMMTAHRHSLFERIFGKVHTKEMCYQTVIPLLILHDK